MDTPNPTNASPTAAPERMRGADLFKNPAVTAKRKNPVGNVKYVVAAPRIVGCTSAKTMAAPPINPKTPNPLPRHVARLAATHQITKSKQHSSGPNTEAIQYFAEPFSNSPGPN